MASNESHSQSRGDDRSRGHGQSHSQSRDDDRSQSHGQSHSQSRDDDRSRGHGQVHGQGSSQSHGQSHSARGEHERAAGREEEQSLKEHEYRDADGNIHHHTRTYMEDHAGDTDRGSGRGNDDRGRAGRAKD